MDHEPEAPGKSVELDSFTQGFVRKCARRLVGKYGFQQQDRSDIEQQLYLKLAKRLHVANPNDPEWKAFVSVTVRRHIVNMIRDREAGKRDHRRTSSINVPIGNSTLEMAASVQQREIPSRRSRPDRTEQEMVDLLIDVTDSVAGLPDAQHREFLDRLKTASISQIARDMDIPRTTLNGWMPQLRHEFETRSLKEYL